MPNVYITFGIVLFYFSSLFAVGMWQHTTTEVSTNNKWKAQQLVDRQVADAAKDKALADYKAQFEGHMSTISAISESYQKELQNAEAQHQKDTAAIRAGAVRLRDYAGSVVCPDNSSAPQTTTPAAGRDGEEGCRLSDAAVEFLLGETGRADSIVQQLSACQQIIVDDRK